MALPGRRLATVLEPFIAEHEAVNYGSNDQWYAVEQALRLLLFSDTPAVHPTPPPALGEHTFEVLDSLGFSGEEIAEMAATGVV